MVAAAPVGEAIAEDNPAANKPILIANGAALPNTGSNGPASWMILVTSLPLIKVAAAIRIAAEIIPPIEIDIIVSQRANF
ncbi:Uncharacterised protein [Staphylococcus gallinarum]|uniref:Uncharacterized protein n=1 Tax=Staphylococcus gallinarum TaxID=1293 RepID=A0A380FDK4_STAGA|nr:Uncharacterised protein [Staphylococcus gallinarum]